MNKGISSTYLTEFKAVFLSLKIGMIVGSLLLAGFCLLMNQWMNEWVIDWLIDT